MQLNKRRTFLIAFAFFAILMLWQVYYYYVPLYLENILLTRYGGEKGDYDNIIGHIMSLDNLAAILIIPLFGWLSDRTKTRMGRRMPYIIFGSILSLILFPLISAMYIYNQVVWYFVVVIALVLAMASFRSPAVSLMPDTTPKPLRANANAIINFVGYIGAILGGALTILFAFDETSPNISIMPFFITSIVLMIVIVLYLLKFNEVKTVHQVKPELELGEEQTEAFTTTNTHFNRYNFIILCGAVFFCWFAFNALQNFGSLYADRILDAKDKWGMVTVTLAVSSLLAFIPSIWLSKKIGRKWSCVVGMIIVMTGLVFAALYASSLGVMFLVGLFAIMGSGWAIIMVNSYPMFVETATAKNVGKITGIYYFVSQGAQFLTSNISGYVFKWLGLDFYFWYAIIFMGIALVICFLYKQKKYT